ncbi:T9SS type A sorting domain-containing protein [Hymenobacter gummosus]|nr:T9SS type A sorting domain-containing protein [Hymenobacter gummosus]
MDTVWTRQLRYYQLLPTARLVRLTTDNHYVMLGENYTNGAREISVHKLDPQGRQLRDTLLQRGYHTDIGGLAVDAATGAYVVAASAWQGPIGRTDVGLLALRPWATVTATSAPRRPAVGPLQAWPNPAGAGQMLLRVRPPHPSATTAELLDLTGRLVRRWPATATVAGAATWELPLAGVAPGVYLLTVYDRAGQRYVARLGRE